MKKLLGSIAVLLAVAGCNRPPDITAADEATVYTLTIVEFHGDAPPTVTQSTITRAQQLRVAAGLGESQNAIFHDTSCVVEDLRMFDQVSYVGNEICFRNAGTATLANHTRTTNPPTTWDSATKSYKAGESGGHFTDHSANKGFFMAFTLHPTAGTPAQNSATVTLTAPESDMGLPLDGGSGGGGDGSDLNPSDLH